MDRWAVWPEAYGAAFVLQFLRKGAMVSIGMGKIVVEFFPAAISTRVCRYRSCKAAGFRLIDLPRQIRSSVNDRLDHLWSALDFCTKSRESFQRCARAREGHSPHEPWRIPLACNTGASGEGDSHYTPAARPRSVLWHRGVLDGVIGVRVFFPLSKCIPLISYQQVRRISNQVRWLGGPATEKLPNFQR